MESNTLKMRLLYFFLLASGIFFGGCSENKFHDGEELYVKYCGTCHNEQGMGLGGLIPPLAGSEFLKNNRDALPCLLRNGIADTIEVKGKIYTEKMEGIAQLSDIDITNILNYINNSWGNQNGLFQLKEVRTALDKCPQKYY